MFLLTSLLIAQSCFVEINGQTVELDICQPSAESSPGSPSVAPLLAPYREKPRFDNPNNIVITNERIDDKGYVNIQGTYRREGSVPCEVAGVEYEVYDKSGNLMERASDEIEDLPPSVGWAFDVLTLVDPEKYGSHRLVQKFCQIK